MVKSGKNIVLTGFMGTGKTVVGRAIAQTLDREFVDMDTLIEQREGMTIPEIFTRYGEAYFRERERELCRELGLENLLEKMPLGIHQIVGETGWQLSHGERSRVCIARALLQESEVVILDESLGTLDPRNRETVLKCAERHSRTLIVIDHP